MKLREYCGCKMSALNLVTRLVVLCSLYATVTSRYLLRSFSDVRNSGDFNHLVVDQRTGVIYVGAVNRLYQLSSTLSLQSSVVTGPKMDNPKCPMNGECECLEENCSESLKKKPTDSINKALVINYETRKIIVCSSLFQGHCEKRKLTNLDQKDEPVYEPMVPNDRNSSVVLFIGPGPPGNDGNPSQVLYIGATRSSVGLDAFRDLVPTVCSRNIQTFFLAKKSFFSTKKEIESTLRKRFLVRYVHGFSSGGFSYFLTVQKESTEAMSGNNYVSRLVRVCQNDDKYFSYTEIPFKCQHNGSYYNILQAAVVGKAGHNLALGLRIPTTEDVLFALFSKSVPGSNKPTGESALCIYSMRSIVTKFTENIKQCFNGVGNTGPAHIAKPQSCYKTNLQINDDYCGEHDINTPIAGTIPAEKTAVLVMHNTRVTAIAVTVTNNYTVSFIGTSTGILKKVVIESKTKAVIYEDVLVEAKRMILSDLSFDGTKNSLYVLTQKKVTQVQIHNCGFYKTCAECLGAKDPFCGWCNLENKCSVRSDCQNQNLRWLAYDGLQCPKITSVYPPEVQIQSQPTTRLKLNINNLPSLTNGNYQCAFKGYDVIHTTSATKLNDNSMKCETPYYNLLPPIPTGSDHIVMTLALRMNGRDFISTNFTFFDCGTHNSCTKCTKSAFPCTWCIKNHKCTNNKEVCGTDILVTGQNTPGITDRPGPQACPRIESSSTEILVPSGKTKVISVKALNLQPFQTDFRCNFNIDGGKEVAGKKVGTEQIECDQVKFQYSSHTADINVPFVITWGRNKALDNPTVIQVKVYKCSVMADNCGSCLTLESKYSCGWCSSSCSTENECAPSTKWLDRSSICPNPQIISVHPLSGPVMGGTTITIEGINLGKIFDEVKDGIVVGGVPCAAREDDYVPAKRIVCVTGGSHQPHSDFVSVMVKNRYRGISAQKFAYVESTISGINPSKGPQSGGTRLTIFGTHMNAGTNITARAADLPCRLVETKENAVVCITSTSDRRKEGEIEMTFDRAQAMYTGRHFSYVPDPIVTKVTPQKSILSGGNRITVEGLGLDAVAQPKMIVVVNGAVYESDCTVNSATTMICYSPNIIPSGILVPVEESLRVTFGFIMDNVLELRNLSAAYPFFTFHYVPNPEFEEFENGIKYFQQKTEYLTINGRNLNLALQKDDIRVMIGKRHCNVTSIAPTQLTCKPHTQQYNSVASKVVVIAGRNLTFEIGELSYEGSENKLGMWTIIGISAGAGLFSIIFLVVLIAVCNKSRENDRARKRMQNQMDVLEARVAKECKEAFAELQTDMNEITSDLDGIGIPFREYRSFGMRVLFPSANEDQHPVTRSLEVEISRRDNMERGLRLFNQLVSNKTFLLLLIRTLESSEDFSMRERVNFASLVSVALQDRMEYYTDILKTLLSDLIERAMDKPNHNKLLLRRTESVAEKMLTNWFTFLLYKFLKECAGEPLFMLYRAIKQQVDKGPVDAVTSEARYSLSEDKLIRQQIDYNILTIYALDPDIQYGTQEHPVKVLDCDTVSQAKEKILDAIFKNQPFSSRPDKDDLELEWRTGRTGRIVLQDEDVTTKAEGEHKRINTLLHYKVPDGAVMALMPRQSSHYNLSIHSDKSGSGSRRFNAYGTNQSLAAYSTYLAGSPALSRSVSPNAINIDIDNGIKFYHLVKPHDSDTQKERDRSSKLVSEIYLTRLLATKGTLQQFVDNLFETIFSTTHRGSALPLAIKYMFDFLDDQALVHGQDPDVVHTWKSNSLPLRFWVNVIKNPDFVFDIHKSNIVDSCLSVVAQTFMDSCSISDHKLGKDSPSSKLLYAKDIPKYKKWVERYYQDIKMMPAISDQDMNATLAEESRHHQNEFNLNAALFELYQYVVRYNEKLLDALDEDEFARKNRLTYKLEQVHNCMESDV